MNQKKIIENALIGMDITPELKGFHYITEFVLMHIENENLLTTQAYKEIAEKHNDTYSRVEKSIRHAIQDRADINSPAYKKYIGNLQYRKNSAFLGLLELHVKEECENESDKN